MIATGKSFESEISASLRAMSKTVAMAYQNSNLPAPVCDHIVWINGTSYLLEEKELRTNRFPFSRITDAERKHAEGVTRAGCKAIILIKHITAAAVRVFACGWSDWLKMEAGWGYVHGAEKQSRGSASFPVVPDWDRPVFLVELHRVTRRDSDGNSLGKHWDLSRVLFPNSLSKSEYDEGQKQWAKFAQKDAQ